jgi:hypothetical protein
VELSADNNSTLVDAIWDEVITAAAHNVGDSGAKYVRELRTNGTYANGAVFLDTTGGGAAGTTDYENGTDTNPSDTLANARTIALSVGLKRIVLTPGSSITLVDAWQGYEFIGEGWTLALGGQDIVGSTFTGATVSGVAAGTGTTQFFRNCIMNATSHIKGTHLIECGIANTQTVAEAGDFFFDRCHSAIAGAATWIFEFGDAIGNTNLNVRNYSGGIQLESMGDTGTDTASIEGQGQIIEGTCAGGTVSVRGMFTISGETNITFSEDARIDFDQISAATWDSTRASHVIAGTFGELVSTSTGTPSLYVDGPFSTHSTAGLETLSSAGLETLSSAGLETAISSDVAAQVWNTTRSNFTAAGSFGQIVSTSTAAPAFYVDGPFSTHSTDGLETLSSAGLETLSSAGLETAISSDVAAQVWNTTRANFTAAGSFGQIVSTSTADPSIWANSAAGSPTSDIAAEVWNTTRANFTAAGSFGQIVSTSTADPSIWANSAAGSPTSDIAAEVWNTTRANFTAAGSFGQIVSTSTADPSIWANSAAGSPTSDIAAEVWNTTRANFTAAGSFGQIVSTSTAAPLFYVDGPFSTHSTDGLETLSSAGLETLSSAGLETATGFATHSASDAAAATWNTTRANFTAAGSFGQIVSTSTAAPAFYVDGPFSTHSTDGLETLSSAGLETLSSAGLETVSSAVVKAAASSAIETETYEELIGAPSSAASIADMSRVMYGALRSPLNVNATNKIFKSHSGAVNWAKGIGGDSATYFELVGTTST